MLRPAVALARLVGALSRLSRRGGGTSLPGKLLLRLEPDAIAELGRQLQRGSVVVMEEIVPARRELSGRPSRGMRP